VTANSRSCGVSRGTTTRGVRRYGRFPLLPFPRQTTRISVVVVVVLIVDGISFVGIDDRVVAICFLV
jgi:hypothetical protein